jgi:hypothetical protein
MSAAWKYCAITCDSGPWQEAWSYTLAGIRATVDVREWRAWKIYELCEVQ